MSVARNDRKSAIKELVRDNEIRTQGELVAKLQELGFKATQATVSRDIADMGLEKDGGKYVLPDDLRVRNLAKTTILETRRAGNQVLVLTTPGSANSMAVALDATKPAGVLGTVAGDDTVLVITTSEEDGKKFQLMIDRLIGIED